MMYLADAFPTCEFDWRFEWEQQKLITTCHVLHSDGTREAIREAHSSGDALDDYRRCIAQYIFWYTHNMPTCCRKMPK